MFPRRFPHVLMVLSFVGLLGGLALTPLGCDTKETEAQTDVSKELLDKLRKEAKNLRAQIDALPQKTPDQRIAHLKIKQQGSVCRVIRESKTNARLGKLTEKSYLVALEDIKAVKDMIKKYPR